jgi:hypothetical protein
MEKWSNTFYPDFLKEERTNCYWFWFKGKIGVKRDKEIDEYYLSKLETLEWNAQRLKNGFYNCFDILTKEYMSGKYNGQTKSEFQKNYKRVKDIVDKSAGDVDKASKLAQTQANRITDEWKAINRAMAAKQTPYLKNQEYEIYEAIFEAFFHRAYELGSVNKQDYREYQLEKLGL